MIDLSYILPVMKARNMTALQFKTGNKRQVTNPYSGESAMLNDEEFALYHLIKYAEESEEYDAMQKMLDKFSRLNAKAYMILLD